MDDDKQSLYDIYAMKPAEKSVDAGNEDARSGDDRARKRRMAWDYVLLVLVVAFMASLVSVAFDLPHSRVACIVCAAAMVVVAQWRFGKKD